MTRLTLAQHRGSGHFLRPDNGGRGRARLEAGGRDLAVDPGYVAGIIQDGVGYVNGEPRIKPHLEAYLGAPESFDPVLIEGSPRLHSKVDGGIHGDIATASMTVNTIPAALVAEPGLRTMRELRLPSFFGGPARVAGAAAQGIMRIADFRASRSTVRRLRFLDGE